MNYIGIDIHKKQCVLSALNEAGERLREARVGTNDRAGFAEYLRAVGGPCRAVIEACLGWGKVHDLIEAAPFLQMEGGRHSQGRAALSIARRHADQVSPASAVSPREWIFSDEPGLLPRASL